MVATPHVETRDNKKLPLLGRLLVLEKLAIFISQWIVGITSRHLYIIDGNLKNDEKPLLMQMVKDKQLLFFSSLAVKNKTTICIACSCQAANIFSCDVKERMEGAGVSIVNHGVETQGMYLIRHLEKKVELLRRRIRK